MCAHRHEGLEWTGTRPGTSARCLQRRGIAGTAGTPGPSALRGAASAKPASARLPGGQMWVYTQTHRTAVARTKPPAALFLDMMTSHAGGGGALAQATQRNCDSGLPEARHRALRQRGPEEAPRKSEPSEGGRARLGAAKPCTTPHEVAGQLCAARTGGSDKLRVARKHQPARSKARGVVEESEHRATQCDVGHRLGCAPKDGDARSAHPRARARLLRSATLDYTCSPGPAVFAPQFAQNWPGPIGLPH